MPQTLNWAIKYPAGSVAPNVPANMQTLAESVDAGLTTLDKGARGLIAINEKTASGTAQSAIYVAQYIPSVTFKANRWYEVSFSGVVLSSVSDNNALAQIQTCATTDGTGSTTGLTEIAGYNLVNTVANASYKFSFSRKIKYSVDTTLMIKGTIKPNTGTITNSAGSTWPGQLAVVDLGAQI